MQYTAAVGATTWAPMDAVLMNLPATLRFHHWQPRRDTVQHAPDIHINHVDLFLDLQGIQRREGHHACIVNVSS